MLAAYLALYPALFAALTTTVRQPAWLLVCIPAFWSGTEYLRGVLFTGFPWELLGYSQYASLPFIQAADLLIADTVDGKPVAQALREAARRKEPWP